MLSDREINQLIALLLVAIVLFFVASSLPKKTTAAWLIMLIPFQAVNIRFGTSSIVIAYIVFLAFMIKKERIQLPLLPHFVLLTLWYLVSMSQAHPSTYVQHAVFMFALCSAFLMFWLCYELTNRFDKPTTIINLFLGMNALVVVYCLVQIALGPGERLDLLSLGGLGNMTRVRDDGRLTGPFQSSEITALYFVLMSFLVVHQFQHASDARWKRVLILLGFANLGCLVATAQRGEFLVFLGGTGVYLWLFRERIGTMRALKLAVAGALVLSLSALVVVNFTQFGGLFDRLARTEISAGIPDTRQVVWPAAWEEIRKRPIVGHGPRLNLWEFGGRFEEHVSIAYPHSLYLFLLFTVGVPGLALFMLLMLTILSRCWRAMSHFDREPYFADLARTGVLLVFLFLIDGIKIEQMRMALADFWHFWFGLCGVFVAAAHRVTVHPGPLAAMERSADSLSRDTRQPVLSRSYRPGGIRQSPAASRGSVRGHASSR